MLKGSGFVAVAVAVYLFLIAAIMAGAISGDGFPAGLLIAAMSWYLVAMILIARYSFIRGKYGSQEQYQRVKTRAQLNRPRCSPHFGQVAQVLASQHHPMTSFDITARAQLGLGETLVALRKLQLAGYVKSVAALRHPTTYELTLMGYGFAERHQRH